jgi:uncharacterized protein YxeA
MKILLLSILLLIYGTSYSQQHNQRPKHNHCIDHDNNNDDDDEDDEEDDDDNDCLPVTLTEFKAKANTNSVKIVWSTETETDNDYFTLFHSPDGYEYYYLTTIDGAGTTHIPKNYYFIDENPYNGVNYYVLTQTDYNGEREMFSPISSYFLRSEDEQYIWKYYNFLGQKIK